MDGESLIPDVAVFEYPDGEARMRLAGLSARRFLELNEWLYESKTVGDIPRVAELVDEFRVGWTWDAESAMEHPGGFPFLLSLARAWHREIGRVPLPLPARRFGPAS